MWRSHRAPAPQRRPGTAPEADGKLDAFVRQRYAGREASEGKAILSGQVSLPDVARSALTRNLEPQPVSRWQEFLENYVSPFA